MTTKRKTLTKSLHTVTAVSRLAVHMYRNSKPTIQLADAVDNALYVLGLPRYPYSDPVMWSIKTAVQKILQGSNKS